MRKIVFALLILGIGFVSCNKEPQPLTKQEIKQKIDSLTSIRVKESDKQAQIDLDYRIKIEVKVKVDSILNALQAQKIKADSVQIKLQNKPKGTITQQQAIIK